jgi:carbamate kinase
VTTLIALGGNALTRTGERGTAAEQLANLRRTCAALAPLLSEGRIVVTHGNGPQVGNELLRQERAAEEAPPLPLYLAVAKTQAEIGALLELELDAVTERPVACLLTHVCVSRDDPAFSTPTKPVGPFYSEEQARKLEQDRGWVVVQDAGRGWRRAVPSPAPLEVVEGDAVRTLLDEGSIVIACGGGGIPVVREDGRMKGVDAVIDKDRASALLATRLEAASLLVLTDVAGLYRDYGEATEQQVRELTPDQADEFLPELPEGSMRPKVEACVAFVRATGGQATITSADALEDALAGRAGTRIRA